jgi:membrane protein
LVVPPWQSLFRLMRETLRRWSDNDGELLAATMSYYAAFSFFPLLLVLIAGLGAALQFSSDAQDAEQVLLNWLSVNVAPVLAAQVKNILTEVGDNAPFSGPVGLAVLLFGAIAIFNHLDFAFDRIWRVKPAEGGVWHTMRRVIGGRLKAFLILCCLGLLIIASMLVSIALTALDRLWVGHWRGLGFAWESLEFLVSTSFHTAIFTVLYKTIPKPKVLWLHALAGALWVAAIWEIGRLTMAYIIAGRNYTPYGVVGSFIAFMVWVYYASSLIFLGAQFVEVLEQPNEAPRESCPVVPDSE